jgi:hypothetical protein
MMILTETVDSYFDCHCDGMCVLCDGKEVECVRERERREKERRRGCVVGGGAGPVSLSLPKDLGPSSTVFYLIPSSPGRQRHWWK